MKRWLISSALCFLAVGASTSAFAQGGQTAAAESAFVRGERAFEQQTYDLAEREFRSAYGLMQGHANQSLILVNIARSIEQQGGRDGEALRLFEQMLRESAGLADSEGLRSARQIAQEHSAALRARGVSSGTGISVTGLVILGAGAAVLVAGAIVGGVALAQRSDVLATCVGTRCPPESEAGARDIETTALVADVLLIGGAVIAATGLILTFVLPGDSGLTAATSCGPTGCFASLEGTFP